MKEKRIVAVIPARFGSSRFPGKPLALICGKPMIQRVYEVVSSVNRLSDCYVATDDERIYQCVTSFGGKAILTGDFSCGTDRVEWASRNIDCDIVINVQGDEPLIKREMIETLISAFDDPSVQMATLKKEMNNDDSSNPNVVKVITDCNGDAIYFSRYAIPYNRDRNAECTYYKHIGIYGYKKDFLSKIVKMKRSPIELLESLEQLRVIWNGYKIRTLESEFDTIGVDTPEQISDIEKLIKEQSK